MDAGDGARGATWTSCSETNVIRGLLDCETLAEASRNISDALLTQCDVVFLVYELNSNAKHYDEKHHQPDIPVPKETLHSNAGDPNEQESYFGFFAHKVGKEAVNVNAEGHGHPKHCCLHEVHASNLERLFPSTIVESSQLYVGGCLDVDRTTNEEEMKSSIAEQVLGQQVQFMRCCSLPLNHWCTCFIEMVWLNNEEKRQEEDNMLIYLSSFLTPILNQLIQKQVRQHYETQNERILGVLREIHHRQDGKATLVPLCEFAKKNLAAEAVNLYYVRIQGDNMYLVRDSDEFQIHMQEDTNSLIGQAAETGKAIRVGGRTVSKSAQPESFLENRFLLIVPIADRTGNIIAVVEIFNRTMPFVWSFKDFLVNFDKMSSSSFEDEKCNWNFLADTDGDSHCWGFSRDDECAMVCACMHAGPLFGSIKFSEQTELQVLLGESIIRVLKAIRSDADIEEYLEVVADAALKLISGDKLCLYLINRSDNRLYPKVCKNIRKEGPMSMDSCLAGTAATQGAAMTERNDHGNTEGQDIYVMCAPISHPFSRRKPLGVLEIHSSAGRNFRPQDLEAMETFCTEVGIALRHLTVDMIFSQLPDKYLNWTKQSIRNVPGMSGSDYDSDDYELAMVKDYVDDTLGSKLQRIVTKASGDSSLCAKKDVSVVSGDTTPSVSSDTSTEGQNEDMFRWNFDILNCSKNKLKQMAVKMLEHFDLLNRFNIPLGTLKTFINTVQSYYHSRPFHNFRHASGAMQSTFLILTSSKALRFLSYLDVLAMLIGALCHDVDHPGHSQNYEVNSKSELALRHNDTSVLEAHHSYQTFKILQREENNIFVNLSEEQYRYCRKVMIRCILGTDMAKHFSLVKSLSDRVARESTKQTSLLESSRMGSSKDLGSKGSGLRDVEVTTDVDQWNSFDLDNEGDRLELAAVIVHAADISAQIADFEIARDWGTRVFEEFRHEAKLHEKAGLTPPPYMLKAKTKYDEYRMQPSFINNVLIPLWEPLEELLGGLELPIKRLRSNARRYEEEADKVESSEDSGKPSS